MIYNKGFYNKMFSYFTSRLGVREYRRGWLKGDCPECGKKDKFGINLYLDKTNCFVCGYHPSPIKLIMVLEDLTKVSEVKNIIGEFREREYLFPIIEKIEEIDINLPSEYVNIALGEGKLAKLARAYIKSRGFVVEEVALKGWGYCNSGEYMGYIIMPYYMGGKLVYYNARRYFGEGVRYKNPPKDSTGLGKSFLIYNQDALSIYRDIYLVEGIINAETLGNQGIATAGKKLSMIQKSIIIKSPIESITIALDPDAIDDAIKLALDFIFHKKVRLLNWGDINSKKDINDIGRTESFNLLNSLGFESYNSLIRLKNSINEKRTIYSYH